MDAKRINIHIAGHVTKIAIHADAYYLQLDVAYVVGKNVHHLLNHQVVIVQMLVVLIALLNVVVTHHPIHLLDVKTTAHKRTKNTYYV